jgi:hypothetical protein
MWDLDDDEVHEIVHKRQKQKSYDRVMLSAEEFMEKYPWS